VWRRAEDQRVESYAARVDFSTFGRIPNVELNRRPRHLAPVLKIRAGQEAASESVRTVETRTAMHASVEPNRRPEASVQFPEISKLEYTR
jgi:hypothetical protein